MLTDKGKLNEPEFPPPVVPANVVVLAPVTSCGCALTVVDGIIVPIEPLPPASVIVSLPTVTACVKEVTLLEFEVSVMTLLEALADTPRFCSVVSLLIADAIPEAMLFADWAALVKYLTASC